LGCGSIEELDEELEELLIEEELGEKENS